jgi:uncharacterized protein (TIGR02302 family)
MSADPQNILNRKVSLARLAIGWERLLEAIFPAMMIAGLVLLAILTGVAGWLPAWAKLAAGAIAAAALLWSLTRLGRIEWPSRDEAILRIEQRSGVKHRPATSYADQLADEASATPEQRALWKAHRARMAREMDRLKPGAPRSPLPRIDQNAMRNALALSLVAAGVLSAGSWRDRVAEAVSLTAPVPAASLSLDAWLNPPSYTAKPPVLLTRPAAATTPATDDQAAGSQMASVSVPQGAELVARLTGSDQLTITLLDPQTSGQDGEQAVLAKIEPEPAEEGAPTKTSQELRTKLDRSAIVSINAGGRDMGKWQVTVIPDTPPTVSIPSDIEQTPTGGFAVPWKVSDDYGVTALGGKLKLSGEQFEDSHVDMSNPFLDTAPELSLSLKKVNPREAEGKNFQDLTEHPWAGLDVELVLEASDQAGQTGTSEVLKFTMPERPFNKPLAKALVEQRRNLFMRPEEERDVVRALLALMIWPEGLIESSGVYLGIRNTASSLYRARTHEDIKEVTDALWQIALTIESGNLPEALKKLQAIKKELEKALAEGASEEKIAELMQQLREAMNEYLQAMQQQMLEEMRKNPQANQQQQQNQQAQQSVRSQDLQKMMDMIEKLAKSGARDAAQQMLSELENILQNLRPGRPQQANPQRNSPMAQMLDQLSEMMRRQQQLMDQTFRMPQNGQQQPGDQNQGQMQPGQEGQEPGQRGQNGQQTPGNGQLSQQQRDLAQMLEKLMEQMRQQGMQPGEGLGRAQQEMGEASGELGQGQRNEALGSQGEAMRGMREGARDMAQQLMQQGTGNEGNIGRHGEGRDADQRDPLGRPMPSQGEEYGQRENMLPNEAAVERARRILDALRSRANEPDRPRIELDYIDRLLKGLY